MTKEEIKQWIRNQIDSSIKTPDKNFKDTFYLCYNKSYIRALKLSTITGHPVNKENFKEGDTIIEFDTKSKTVWYSAIIGNYLLENYSKNYSKK